MFHQIDPQDTITYKYDFGGNHLPGTFWYHPHFHGSTTLQGGQGAAGLLIIEDDDVFEIPIEIKDMPQVEMVIQHIDLFYLREASVPSGDTTWDEGDDQFLTTNATTDSTNLMLVNMQYLPLVIMEVGKWYRWHVVLSSAISSLAIRPELAQSGCEFQFLAKDGIYLLADGPRQVPGIILAPGNRADVAVRCNTAGNHNMVSEKDTFSNLDTFAKFYDQDEDIMILNVVADPNIDENKNKRIFASKSAKITKPFAKSAKNAKSSAKSAKNKSEKNPYKNFDDNRIKPFTVRRPCYLVDLMDAPAAGPFEVSMRKDAVNNQPWVDKDTYLNAYDLGTVQDIGESVQNQNVFQCNSPYS